MSDRKRSSRRNRRPPVRHSIKVREVSATAERATATPQPESMPRMPAFEPVMFGMLAKVSVELVPLYTALAVVHDDMSGAHANACVPICHQLAGALAHLGFDAEVMTACAQVGDRDRQDVTYADIGVWDRPPIVRPDGTTDGHVVLWANSFRRLVDPTIAQAPMLMEAARTDVQFTLPTILPVASREQLLSMPTISTAKGPYLITWMLLPDWNEALMPALFGDIGEAMPYATLALAYECLHVMRALGEERTDLRQLHNRYPRLGDLLAGRRQLPELPSEPPAAFVRIRRAARGTG
ncbi:hypothetical protein [Actinomadura sp. 6N118]|uniref:hypothetical protein n=1 Tax=Actinomadura sp. 6N118 TaxID=3375151 RepID=UPI00378E52CF